MNDFGRPEYASYLALCRELRLEREVRPGDAALLWHDPERIYINTGRAWHSPEGYFRAGQRLEVSLSDQRDIWLPSLADWLDMLATDYHAGGYSLWTRTSYTAGPRSPEWHRSDSPMSLGWACRPINAGQIDYDLDPPDSPTPEEAIARLWLAAMEPVR